MPAKIAILIDAENVDPSFANQIFSYARSLGEVTIREIYGAGIALNEWADPILENTIHPNFTLRPNRFKNSSDIALTIGAMELLSARRNASEENEKIAAVIIASSDSDFSPLAFHLRAAGIDVIGMGEPGRINPMWPKACTEFVTLSSGQPLVRQNREAAPIIPPPSIQPVDETPSVEVSAPPSKPTEEKKAEASKKDDSAKKNEAVKIAHSHSARVQLIRSFISEQLAAHGGRIKSGELFKLLSTVPNYKFDQQRSHRKPLDYLETQFAAWFVLEPGENGSVWISLRTVADSHMEQQPVADEQPIEITEDDDQHSADALHAVEEQPTIEKDAESLPDDPRVALIDAGIPIQDADRVAALLSESKNLFAAYNGLTKAFGRKIGGQYYKLIKERFEGPAPAPVQMEMTTEEQPMDEVAPQDEEQPQREATLEQFLVVHGLSTDRAATVSSVVNSSANLRIAYNELRKDFGATDGRAYLALVKEYKGAQQ